jgi:hypothetical protein
MPTRLTLASFARMQADKPYRAALCQRMPSLGLLASFGVLLGILGGMIAFRASAWTGGQQTRVPLPADGSICLPWELTA